MDFNIPLTLYMFPPVLVFILERVLGLLNPILSTVILIVTIYMLWHQAKANKKKAQLYDTLDDKAREDKDDIKLDL